MSALLVVANMAFDLVSEGKLGYGENICYISSNLGLLLPLVTPVGVIVLPNLLEKVPQDLFHSVYFEYEENCTHDRLLSLNYAFCHIKR